MQSVVARAQVARCLAELGAFAEGRTYAEEALRLAETVDHPYSFACACDGVGHFFLRQGALSQAIHVFERALALREAVKLSADISSLPCGLRCSLCPVWKGNRGSATAGARAGTAAATWHMGLHLLSSPSGWARAMCWLAA